MQLIWHQFRKDFRLLRGGLAVWWGLLVADLILILALPGSIEFHPLLGFNQGPAFAAGFSVFLLWLGVLLLPAAVVLTDSPLRENAFVRTRPVPRRSILGSKLLFIALCILAPACLVELVHLLARGFSLGWAAHAAGERLLFLAPVVLAAAAFGGLWRSAKELTAGGVVFGGFAWGGFLAVWLISDLLHTLGLMEPWNDDPHESRLLVWQLVALAGFASVLWLGWTGRLHPARRWVAMPSVALAAGVIGFLPAWDLFPIRALDPDGAGRLHAEGMVKLGWADFALAHNGETPEGRVLLGGGLSPGPSPAGTPLTVDWATRDAFIELDSGRRVESDHTTRPGGVFNWRSGLNEQDLRAFEPLLGQEMLFLSDFVSRGGGMVSLGRLVLDAIPTNRARIKANLEGRAFRWSVAARLPVRAGSRAEDAAGSWAVVGVGSRGNHHHFIGVRRDQVALRTTRDAVRRRFLYWPATQHEFLFLDPKRQFVFLQGSGIWTSLQFGSHTGVASRFLTLELAIPSLLQSEHSADLPEGLELWILRRDYLGDLRITAETPEFELAALRPPMVQINQVNDERLDEAGFRRRLEEIAPPAPGAGRSVVGNYLVQVLRLIEARRAFIHEDDPIVAQLAAVVPEHLDLILDALPYAESFAARTLRHAIRRGTPEARAAEVVAALPRDPELAGVVLARGWEHLAAPIAGRLARIPSAMPVELMRLLALSEDPAIRRRLLAEFEQRPSVKACEALRVDGYIEPDLAASLDAIWEDRPRTIRPETQVTRSQLLLRTGRPEALEQLLRVLRLVPEAQLQRLWALLDGSHQEIVIEGLDRSEMRDPAVLAARLRDKQADDFDWDPNRHRWVLRPTSPPLAQP